MYRVIVVTPASTEPVTSTEAYNQLKIDAGFDDDHVAFLLSSARDKAEKFCNRFFTVQTIKVVYYEPFEPNAIHLPFPDITSVDDISYIDESNARQTIAPADYDLMSDEQVIYPASSFPSGAKSYTVTLTTGVPEEMSAVKIAILMLLTDLYELRTDSVVGFSVSNNPAVYNFLWPYRVELGV